MLASADGNLIGFLFLKAGVSQGEMKEFFADKTQNILRLQQTTVAGYSNAWSFDFRDTKAGVIGTGRAVLGAGSTAALVLVMAKQGAPAALGGAAESWIRALRFAGAGTPQTGSQPAATTQPAPATPGAASPPSANPFSGRHIQGVRSYSGGDLFEMTTLSLDLCGDGSYSSIVKRESSSVSGTLSPSQNTTRESGTWSISGAAPEWTITLRNAQGAASAVPVRGANGTVRFGNMAAQVSPAANCR
jgi:hypothetical protein